HVMEECFLAAKDGREVLSPPRVDQLLKAVDVLGEVRTLAEPDLPAWTLAQSDRISALAAQLKAPPPVAAVAQPAEPPAPTVSSAPVAGAGGASVRVAASVLNRMLFLAGESTV